MSLLPLWPSLNGEFIIADTNCEAYNAVITQQWPNNILIIYGSWGKSHLARILNTRGYVYANPAKQSECNNIIWDEFPIDCNNEAIFHNWNYIVERKYKLFVTMSKAPQLCNILPFDLKSRMCAAYSVKIKPPNYDLRQKIFVQWLQNGGIEIHPNALEYFFREFDGSLIDLSAAAKQLHQFALTNQRKLTIHCIKAAFDIKS